MREAMGEQKRQEKRGRERGRVGVRLEERERRNWLCLFSINLLPLLPAKVIEKWPNKQAKNVQRKCLKIAK